MPWFKVDDGLHKSRKRIRLGRSIEGLAALGLWTHLGSWCADELTEGFVSDEDLDYHLPEHGQELAKRLEAVGLFERVTRYGEEGWYFHDWEDYQPSKEEVLADRAANAARQKRFRDKAKAAREAAAQTGDAAESNAVSNGVTNAAVTPVVTVPPTRPDPYQELPTEVLNNTSASLFEIETAGASPGKKPRAPKAAKVDVEPEGFAEFYDRTYPRKDGRTKACEAWPAAVAKKSVAELLALAAQYRALVIADGRERRHILLPSTWLNQGRWDDDLTLPTSSRASPRDSRTVSTAEGLSAWGAQR